MKYGAECIASGWSRWEFDSCCRRRDLVPRAWRVGPIRQRADEPAGDVDGRLEEQSSGGRITDGTTRANDDAINDYHQFQEFCGERGD